MRLSHEGARVVVVDVDGAVAEEVAASLPGEAVACRADVSAERDVEEYVRAAVQAFGTVDVHHLNAGIVGGFGRIPELELAEFEQIMSVNVRGQFLGLRAAFRLFEQQGSGGSLVLTSSIHGLRGSADMLPYQASKHAVIGLVQGAAMYGGPLGIRVNGVAPGVVPTARDAEVRADMTRRASTTPLRRAGREEEVAAAVAFLLSDESTYITGEVLTVDGGAAVANVVRPSSGAGAWDAYAADRALYGNDWTGPVSDGSRD